MKLLYLLLSIFLLYSCRKKDEVLAASPAAAGIAQRTYVLTDSFNSHDEVAQTGTYHVIDSATINKEIVLFIDSAKRILYCDKDTFKAITTTLDTASRGPYSDGLIHQRLYLTGDSIEIRSTYKFGSSNMVSDVYLKGYRK